MGCYSIPVGGGVWSRIADMQTGRSYLSLTAVGNILVAVGGRDGGDSLDTVEIYRNGSWSTAAWTLQERVQWHCTVATSPSSILIIGGYIGGSGTQQTVNECNVLTGTRTPRP